MFMKFGWLFVAGMLAGALMLVAGSVVLEQTNTTAFCISCHEMKQTVYQEYLASPHNINGSGVTAGCADCHVPAPLAAKLYRKVIAVKDIYHSLLGTIDTPEKFEARRELLAERVWQRMKASDSQTCRTCHAVQRMDPHKQSRRAREKMQPGLNEGKTCIDCHKGIAHQVPDDE